MLNFVIIESHITSETYYGSYVKYVKGGTAQKNYIPSLKCPQIKDILRLPVGLITVDEYMLAGGGINISGYTNIMVWLHTGENYWTMSPSSYRTSASVIIVNGNGYLDGWYVTSASPSIRPVINLKSTTKFKNIGTGLPGSSTNPYKVVS